MYIFITILILLASLLMIFVVLIQKSKGGGLASGFASSNQIMGVRKTTDFLEKFTWTLAAVVIVLSILTAKYTASRGDVRQSEIEVHSLHRLVQAPLLMLPQVFPFPQLPFLTRRRASRGIETRDVTKACFPRSRNSNITYIPVPTT